MPFQDQLKSFKVELDQELDKYLIEKALAASKVAPEAGELVEHIKELTLRGGKRIRAALLYFSYLAHGGVEKEKAMRAAMGMEMSETFLLTHDDIIDQDSIRRGGITIHKDYEEICRTRYTKNTITPEHFGQSVAIMAGVAGQSYMNDLVATSGFAPEYVVRATIELGDIIEREVFGETLDVIIELRDNPTKEDVTLVQQLKTAPYTFDSPVKLGAIFAGANKEHVKSLEAYTMPLGTVFQIQDDILGMFGSVEKTGKPVVSDLREGKITLLILDALETASDEQKQIIERNLGNINVTDQDLEDVKKVIVDTGALEKSRQAAKKLAQQGRDALPKLKVDGLGRDFLIDIAEYIIAREY